MSPDDLIRLRHMAEAAQQALQFNVGRARDDLARDAMLRMATVYAIQVLGEAAAKVSPQGQQALPGLPWRAVMGMRNRLVHAYFDIDHDILWDTVQLALPELLQQLRTVTGVAPDQPSEPDPSKTS